MRTRSLPVKRGIDPTMVRGPLDPGIGSAPLDRPDGFTLDRAVDTKSEIRDFLTSRRARITPEEVGLPTYGARRVPGLRREEVATLAGVSVDYYNRMERGNLSSASESVLDALAGALRLDEAERAHLHNLARASQPSAPRRRRSAKQAVRPSVQWMLDSMTGSAAIAENGRLDALATNQLARAFYSHLFEAADTPVNFARFIFLDPRAGDFYADWERSARDCVALLRSEAGRNPFDRGLSDLVGELSTRSEEFRDYWATHDVRLHNTGEKHFNHPVVGDLELSYNRIELPGDAGLTIVAYTPEPGSRSADAFGLLASWAVTEEAQAAGPGDASVGKGSRDAQPGRSSTEG
jgi:transcriptional regulator with XRE-family HTH domain